jgi:CheY-like chemotaxis protein
LNEDVHAFHKAWRHLGEALSEGKHVVPLRSVFPLAFVVLPGPSRRDRESCDGSAVRQLSGVELHRHLLASRCNVPVIFITGNGFDDRTRSEAASDWTVAYFRKPFCGDELLEPVHTALKWKPGK